MCLLFSKYALQESCCVKINLQRESIPGGGVDNGKRATLPSCRTTRNQNFAGCRRMKVSTAGYIQLDRVLRPAAHLVGRLPRRHRPPEQLSGTTGSQCSVSRICAVTEAYFGVCPIRRAAQRRSQSCRAIRARGKPARIEQQFPSMDKGGCSMARQRAENNQQRAKLVAGRGELA